jgi:Flp pilus assembly pilin Flp
MRLPLSPSIDHEVPVRAVSRFVRSEQGIAVTEYGLLVALIAVLLIAVVMIFGSSIASWFSARTSAITTS